MLDTTYVIYCNTITELVLPVHLAVRERASEGGAVFPLVAVDDDVFASLSNTTSLSTDYASLVTDSASLRTDSASLWTDSASRWTDSASLSTDYASLVTDSASLVTDSASLRTDFASLVPDSAPLVTDSASLWARSLALSRTLSSLRLPRYLLYLPPPSLSLGRALAQGRHGVRHGCVGRRLLPPRIPAQQLHGHPHPDLGRVGWVPVCPVGEQGTKMKAFLLN